MFSLPNVGAIVCSIVRNVNALHVTDKTNSCIIHQLPIRRNTYHTKDVKLDAITWSRIIPLLPFGAITRPKLNVAPVRKVSCTAYVACK